MSKARDIIIGDRRGYVLERNGQPARVVVEVGDVDYSMTLKEAETLGTLLFLLRSQAGAVKAPWIATLAHNIAVAGALAYEAESERRRHVTLARTRCECGALTDVEGRTECPACWRWV